MGTIFLVSRTFIFIRSFFSLVTLPGLPPPAQLDAVGHPHPAARSQRPQDQGVVLSTVSNTIPTPQGSPGAPTCVHKSRQPLRPLCPAGLQRPASCEGGGGVRVQEFRFPQAACTARPLQRYPCPDSPTSVPHTCATLLAQLWKRAQGHRTTF